MAALTATTLAPQVSMTSSVADLGARSGAVALAAGAAGRRGPFCSGGGVGLRPQERPGGSSRSVPRPSRTAAPRGVETESPGPAARATGVGS